MKPLLITMPHSHFSEKARWALDLSGVEYIEKAYPPLFHWMATIRRGGRSVPVLVHNGRSYTDSTDILLHLDEMGVELYPHESDLRKDVLRIEEEFDLTLGPHTRRWAYAQLLPHSALLLKIMAPGTAGFERTLLPAILPIAKPLIRNSLRISEQSALRSLRLLDQVFDQVEQRLQGGCSYLIGNRFTAADLTFASLAAPALLPPQYRSQMPELEEVPQSMRNEVLRLRKTVAGRYALRLFEEYRQPRSVTANEA
jgi:glutathione S-transferase